jgi:hypothetical protein
MPLDPGKRQLLARLFSRALSPEQLQSVCRHLDAGVKPCCEDTADWFLHPSGRAGIEVLANEAEISGLSPENISKAWQRTFLDLCRAGKTILATRAFNLKRHGKPLTTYTELMAHATPDEVLRAAEKARILWPQKGAL